MAGWTAAAAAGRHLTGMSVHLAMRASMSAITGSWALDRNMPCRQKWVHKGTGGEWEVRGEQSLLFRNHQILVPRQEHALQEGAGALCPPRAFHPTHPPNQPYTHPLTGTPPLPPCTCLGGAHFVHLVLSRLSLHHAAGQGRAGLRQ